MMSCAPLYTLRPGFETRLTPLIAGVPFSLYLSVTSNVFLTFFPFFSTAETYPASLSFSAIASLKFENGSEIFALPTARAFARRVMRSATGSFVIRKSLPRGFLDAGYIALKRLLAEADAAKTEIAHEAARTPALETAAN